MITQFFTMSGYAMWIIILAVLILDVMFLSGDDDLVPWAMLFSGSLILILVLFTDAFTGVRLATALAAAAAYMVTGVLWSIFKWYLFVIDRKRALKAASTGSKPVAAAYKQRIVGWMTLWPFSLTWWVMTWPREAFVRLYERLSTLYDRISTHIWESN